MAVKPGFRITKNFLGTTMLIILIGIAFSGKTFSQRLSQNSSTNLPENIATFSIVARDPATGELGIAVASRFFAVGAVVPWARADVGAIATQSFANTSFGWRGLDLLEKGKTPDKIVQLLLKTDTDSEKRQFGIVAANGQ